MVSPVVSPREPSLRTHLPQPEIQRFRRTISSRVRLGDGTGEGCGNGRVIPESETPSR